MVQIAAAISLVKYNVYMYKAPFKQKTSRDLDLLQFTYVFVLPSEYGERISMNCLFQGRLFTPYLFQLQIGMELGALLLLVYQCPYKKTWSQNTIPVVHSELKDIYEKFQETLVPLNDLLGGKNRGDPKLKERMQKDLVKDYWGRVMEMTHTTPTADVKEILGQVKELVKGIPSKSL